MRERNFSFYMLNLGIEVERMFQYYKVDEKKFFAAVQRFLDLYGFILKKFNSSAKQKELARLKEGVLEYFFGENRYKFDLNFLKKYFMTFYNLQK